MNWLWGLLVQSGLTIAATLGFVAWAFRTWGERWLAARFDSQLAEQARQHERELEKLRFKINAMMDRTAKLHQYEFEILPELWGRLTDAFSHVMGFVSPWQTHPDLDKMGNTELSEFLEKCNLENWQKEDLKQGADKGRRYFKMAFWPRLQEASATYHAFRERLMKTGIFLPEDTKAQMTALADMMFDALSERRLEEEHPELRKGRFAKGERLRSEGEELKATIEVRSELACGMRTRLVNPGGLPRG